MTRSEGGSSSHSRRIPKEATSHSALLAFNHGTGLSLFRELLLPAIINARHEIVLATCFWAASETLNQLVLALRELSRSISTTDPNASTIKVYICFSSRSVIQKLFHTSSPDGFVYQSHKWPEKLGLPSPQELPGLDIKVKSLFFRPFSVLHSKYVIIDRKTVFLPSCNVSWEDWYECAVGLRGPIVRNVFEFWNEIWKPAELIDLPFGEVSDGSQTPHSHRAQNAERGYEPILKSTLLPHPHDASLQQAFWFLPTIKAALPESPLNVTLLQLVTHAKTEVILLTPNFTSKAAFTAVCFALLNGVHVHLITNRRMMVAEQLATAGVLTEQYVNRLVREYQGGFNGRKLQAGLIKLATLVQKTPPERLTASCKLKISYFRQPRAISLSSGADLAIDPRKKSSTYFGVASNATKSHIKLTLVDRKAIVLGSGNMDRASWRTSQELGVLIEDQDRAHRVTSMVEKLWNQVESGLEGCLETYFDG